MTNFRYHAQSFFSKHLFLLSFVSIFIIHSIFRPSLIFYPEFFADEGINFLYTIINKSFHEGLFYPDAGYLPLFQRIYTYLVKYIIPTQYWNFGFQYGALFYTAIALSSLSFKSWRLLIPSDLTRYLLILLFAAYPNLESFSILNCGNMTPLLLISLALVDNEKMPWWQIIPLSLLMIILIPSKPHVMIVLPIYTYLCITSLIKKNFLKTKLFYTGSMIGFVIEAAYLINTKINGALWQGPEEQHQWWEWITQFFILTYHHVTDVFFSIMLNYLPGVGVILFLIGITTLGVLLIKKAITKKEFRFTLFYVFLFIAIGAAIALDLITDTFAFNKIPFQPTFSASRHWINASFFGALAITTTLIYWITQNKLKKLMLVTLNCFVLLSFILTCTVIKDMPPHQEQISQWKYYHSLINEWSYTIPLNAGWVTTDGEFFLNADNNLGSNLKPLNTSASAMMNIKPFTNNRNITGLIIDLSPEQRNMDIDVYIRKDSITSTLIPMTPKGYRYRYYRFPGFLGDANQLAFLSNKIPIAINPNIFLFGQPIDIAYRIYQLKEKYPDLKPTRK